MPAKDPLAAYGEAVTSFSTVSESAKLYTLGTHGRVDTASGKAVLHSHFVSNKNLKTKGGKKLSPPPQFPPDS